ncbi:DUF4232 domain-containing protein [Streptomyces sp. NPDC127117]|uniref:DUF4232 domain-containing protein n=1 Tax=Streptomyces sp. NPDC127117 TaxID=3345368 RepID=UPI003645245B
MRTRARTRIAAVGALAALSALALTGCNNGDEADAAAGSSAPSSDSASGSTAASSGSNSSTSGGGSSSNGGDSSSSNGGGATAACTVQTVSIKFLMSGHQATEQQAANGTLKLTNTSGATCTVVGPTTVTATDDENKTDPISADNSEEGSDAVDIPAGGSATADIGYNNLNTEGTARDTCPMGASTVKVGLPKQADTTVNVLKADGSPGGYFSVCGNSFKVGAFTVG